MINDLYDRIDWNAFSGIVNLISVIITATLTYIIISQTRKISRNQNELEKKLSDQQMMIQKRQIRVDIFPYKREIYLNLFKVLEFANFLDNKIFTLKLEDKSPKDIFNIYTSTKDNYLGDIKNIMQSLRESEYILPANISSTVLQIYRNLDDICSNFMALPMLQDILSADDLYESKIAIISKIKEDCKSINSKVDFILSIMPNELNISRLDN